MPTQISPDQLKYYQTMEQKGKEFEKLTQHHGEWKSADAIFAYEQTVNQNFQKKDDQISRLTADNGSLQEANKSLGEQVKSLTEAGILLKEQLADCKQECQDKADSKYQTLVQSLAEICTKILSLEVVQDVKTQLKKNGKV